MSNAHNHIALARELAEHFLSAPGVESGNGELFEMLEGAEDGGCPALPGESIEAIRANIKRALSLASQPVQATTTGRNRERQQVASELQRKDLHLLCRVALALLEDDHA